MTRPSSRHLVRLLLTTSACALGSTLVTTQAPATPPPQGPAAPGSCAWCRRPARARRTRRRRGLPEASASRPSGSGRGAEDVPAAARLQDRAGADRPADRGSGRCDLRWQRSHVRAGNALLHAGRGRFELARADQPDFAARRHRRRRHLRQAHGVRGQHGDAADCVSARGRRDPRARDRQPRHVQVHRHERRRCRRQEGTVLCRRGPRHEHGVAAGRPDLGARQLALHDLQPVPPAHCAGRQGAARGDRSQRRAVVVGSGQLRQDVVGRWRRRNRPRQLPDADRLRGLQRFRQLRARLPGAVAGAGRHRRHAGRHAPRPAARRHAQSLHRGVGRRDLSRRSAAPRIMVGDLFFNEPVGRIVRRAESS